MHDCNDANIIIKKEFSKEWRGLKKILHDMPLHLQGSDQKGKKGSPIFGVKETNRYLKEHLSKSEWKSDVKIPTKYNSFGIGVDFGKKNILVEVQFANYPFVINNIIRSEVFCKSCLELIPKFPVKLLIIITKAHKFPASNSTLYYEQAKGQIDFLLKHEIVSIPIRLIGLTVNDGDDVEGLWTSYAKERYSRTVSKKTKQTFKIKTIKDGIAKISKN